MTNPALAHFETLLTPTERELMDSLDSPSKIQAYLDKVLYCGDDRNRSPLQVIREGECHCYDGGLFGALALWRIGYPPRILDLLPDDDDDHVLAVYQLDRRYGAVAKSNFANLRLREPVYPNIRTLVYTYFDPYFNVDGVRTLRGYTRLLNLESYTKLGWMWDSAGVDILEKRLYSLKQIPLIDAETAKCLSPVDAITYKAGLMIANPDGLYKPKHGGE
jgi:hypothetical protein